MLAEKLRRLPAVDEEFDTVLMPSRFNDRLSEEAIVEEGSRYRG